MATERLPTRKTREIVRLKWELRLSNRDAARSVGVSAGTVDNVQSRATKAGLSGWVAVEGLSDDELEALPYQRAQVPVPAEPRAEPDCAGIHRERRRPGVTLELLHQEYLEQHPNGLRYSAFCERYRAFPQSSAFIDPPTPCGWRLDVCRLLRQEAAHRGCDDRRDGGSRTIRRGARRVQLHYAEATHTQQVPDFIGSHKGKVEVGVQVAQR